MFAVPAIAVCVMAAIVGSGTVAMLEPVVSLYLAEAFRLTPARIGAIFGIAALVGSIMHPVWGQLGDRHGALRLTFLGLYASACLMPLASFAIGPWSACAMLTLLWLSLGLIVTPSLAHISGAAEAAGLESYGVVYGLYNVAWAIGVMFGPAIGGWIYDRAGFRMLTFVWAPFIIVTALALRARAVRQEVSFRAIEHRAT